MQTPNEIVKRINALSGFLIGAGLADDQRFAFQRSMAGNLVHVTFEKAELVSVAMKDRSYNEIYQQLTQERAFTVKLLDGALVQMMYAFLDGDLQSHRLGFFPSPHLEEFQNSPDIYLNDEIYADVVAKNIVPFPVRFDYNAQHFAHELLMHPRSHLTLGQYENCRIPVSAPLTPGRFIDFILRNFYHTAFARYADDLPVHGRPFAESILSSERNIVHVVIPR